ncbi:17-beta-hydroxysteroid dehydrogenase 14 isoform X4 [Lacerta agilis]|uniref:17-beta-hydroxysteroid dehydrogenase 14 isoform X4 n=1 Tax=Lacerta agilis TaxID=80427 RepID=UPI001419EC34|nr:17-beta-hydroxysteroid dehydrogenase 14 isoform X4 [Lacerta agilis]
MPGDTEHAQWAKPHVATSASKDQLDVRDLEEPRQHLEWQLGCVRHGAKVVFCAPGSEGERGKVIEKELNDSAGPGEGRFEVCDVLRETDIKTLVSVTVELYGQLDCLVNNAGSHPPDQTIDDVSAQEFRSLMDLNVVSCFLAAKTALPHLRKTKGNIINIASLVGLIGQKYAVPYVATKGAVTAMTKAMAIDESKYGVRVNRNPQLFEFQHLTWQYLDSYVGEACKPDS